MASQASTQRLPLLAAAVVSAGLVPVGLGWVPFGRYAWGFNLWQYLPAGLVLALAAMVLALGWHLPRELLLRGARAAGARIGSPGVRMLGCSFVLVVPVLLWLLRERQLYGDSPILLYVAGAGWQFLFPDVGASYLFQLCHRVGVYFGETGRPVLQVLVCVSGGITVACFLQIGRYLTPGRGSAVFAAALILCGGFVRVFAGHIEVYGFVLMCAALYLWSALAFLRGRCGLAIPSLALGLGLWMHLSFSFLAPSLLVLLYLGAPGLGPRKQMGRFAAGLALTGVPLIVFLGAMLVTGHSREILGAWNTMLEWAGIIPSPINHEAFVRGFFASPGAGTRYVIFSGPHLKYLANAFFLLTPAMVPVIIAFAIFSPRRLVATPEARFLSTASLCMLAYAAVVRPVWGPYDWDVFSLTAIFLASLAAYLLVNQLDDPPLVHLGVLLIGTTLLFVTIPFVLIGISPYRQAGPFAYDVALPIGDETPLDAVERVITPWL